MSTYLSLHYHVVFSTKNRAPLIASEWRGRLHEYLGRTIRNFDGQPEGIGGVADHVHLLFGLKATHRLADLMRELKKASSVWMREQAGQGSFAWQEGYAAFTVSPTARDAVRGYIARQEEHHRERSFRDELEDLLNRAEVAFDPEYLK